MHNFAKVELVILTAFAALFRFYNLHFQCIWTEEQYTAQMSARTISEIIQYSITTDFTPPIYYLLAHVADPRVVSAVAGVLLIPVMYYCGMKYRNEQVGLISAAFTTISQPLIYYSQFGRAYSLALLLFAVTLYFYLDLRKSKDALPSGMLYLFIATATIYVHLYAAIPIIVMTLLLDRKFESYIILGIGMLISPLAAIVANAFYTRTNAVASYGLNWWQLLYITPLEFFSGAWIPCLYLAITGFWNSPEAKDLFLISIVTIAVAVVASFFTPMFARYYLFVLIIATIIISAEIDRLIEKSQFKTLIVFTILTAIVFLQFNELSAHYYIQKYTC